MRISSRLASIQLQPTCQDLLRLTLVDPHAVLIPFVKSTMRRMASLKTPAAGLEVVASAETLTIETGEEFGSRVAMEVGKPERVGSYVPAGTKPEKVSQRGCRIAGLGGQNGEDGGVGVVD